MIDKQVGPDPHCGNLLYRCGYSQAHARTKVRDPWVQIRLIHACPSLGSEGTADRWVMAPTFGISCSTAGKVSVAELRFVSLF